MEMHFYHSFSYGIGESGRFQISESDNHLHVNIADYRLEL